MRLPAEQWRVLDQAHGIRNRSEYEGIRDVDEALLEAVIRIAKEIEKRVRALGPVSAA